MLLCSIPLTFTPSRRPPDNFSLHYLQPAQMTPKIRHKFHLCSLTGFWHDPNECFSCCYLNIAHSLCVAAHPPFSWVHPWLQLAIFPAILNSKKVVYMTGTILLGGSHSSVRLLPRVSPFNKASLLSSTLRPDNSAVLSKLFMFSMSNLSKITVGCYFSYPDASSNQQIKLCLSPKANFHKATWTTMRWKHAEREYYHSLATKWRLQVEKSHSLIFFTGPGWWQTGWWPWRTNGFLGRIFLHRSVSAWA